MATIALLKVTSSAPSTAIVVGLVNRPVPLTHSTPFAFSRLGDAARHLLDDAVLPGGRLREVELRLGDADAELRERLAGVVQRMRGLHPRLGRDTPDPEARAADLGLLLDAHDLATELGRANRSRVSRRPSSEDGDVTFHSGSTFRR